MRMTFSILISLFSIFISLAHAVPLTQDQSNWDGEGLDVQEALNAARATIPKGWVEDPARYSSMITCKTEEVSIPVDTEWCVDEYGRHYPVLAIIPIKAVNLE